MTDSAQPLPRVRPPPPPYWVLEDYSNSGISTKQLHDILLTFKYAANKNPTHYTEDRLQYLISRAQRGLISYEKVKVEELRQFCRNRKLGKPTNLKKTPRNQLVGLLEKAKEEATFHFMDLVPELRNIIYGFHFASLGAKDVYQVPPPPVACTSRQLRAETRLPFYSGSRFRIQVTHERLHRSVYCLAESTSRFLDTADPDILRVVDKICISAAYEVVREEKKKQITTWYVDFAKGDKVWNFTGKEWSSLTGAKKEARRVLTERLTVFFDGMAVREEGMKLRREDGAAVLRIFDGFTQETRAAEVLAQAGNDGN